MLSLFNYKKKRMQGVVRILSFIWISFSFFFGVWSVAPLFAGSDTNLSTKKEKHRMVKQGVADYQSGNYAAARKTLEKVEPGLADNYAVPYYLGLIYLEEGNRTAAISKWQQYVKMDSQSENAMKMRKYLTLLLRMQAREDARKALIQEKVLEKAPATQNTIAVTTFENIGYMIFGSLGKGLSAMLISDLSHVPDITVVDRIRIQELLEEMGMGTSGMVDDAMMPKVAKLLQADHMIAGDLKDVEKENLQITSSVLNTTEKEIVSTEQAKGALSQFYVLEKEIACKIVKILGKNCDNMSTDFHKIHTHSISALIAFSWGLDYFDQNKYDQAREMFQKALEKDPNFELAKKALLSTPTNTMALMPTSEIISDLSSNPISLVAGSTSTEKKGISKTVLIGGGLAIAAGGALIAGSGGGSSSSEKPPIVDPPNNNNNEPNLSGKWGGGFGDTSHIGAGIRFEMNITQSESSIKGDIRFSGWQCMTTADVTGEVSYINNDCRIYLTIQSSSNLIKLNGECTNDTIKTRSIGLDSEMENCDSGVLSLSGERAE